MRRFGRLAASMRQCACAQQGWRSVEAEVALGRQRDTHRGSGERDEQPGVAAAWSVCARQGEVPLSVTTGCSRALRARTVGVLGRSARKRGASKVPLRLARPHSNLADLETGTARCQHTPTASGNWKRQRVVRSHHGDRTPAQHAQIIVCGACGRFAGRAGIATATTQRL